MMSANDLIEMLNWQLEEKRSTSVQKQLFISLTETEQTVHDFLVDNGKELLDIISLHCKLPIHQTTTILFNLEMKGVVKPLPGKLFEAV